MVDKRRSVWKYLIVSFSIALLWQIIAGRMYGYKYNFAILGINLYALMLWGLGLAIAIVLYDGIEYLFKIKNKYVQFLVFTLFFWIALIIFETVAYHVIGTKNLVTAQYPGLPICNCIHAPIWMKITYFCMGPVMYITSRMFKLENVFGDRK